MARTYRPEILFFERPESVLVGSFFALAVIGGALLSLPASTTGPGISFVDALFTSTSAVCVTGLTVVDTGKDYSRFGQAVILALIQLGGLGIMTFAALATQLLGRRMSFRSQALIADTFWQGDAAASFRRDLARMIALTFSLEAIGVVLLYAQLRHASGGAPPFYSAVFHSISAFCNAGFSLYSDNLISLRNNPLIMLVIMTLVISGGLGHTVLLEIGRRLRCRITGIRPDSVNWSLHSRVVLWVSAVLIGGGAVAIFIVGLGDRSDAGVQRVVNALFQSVSARTAGFNTVDLAGAPIAALLFLVLLMFIGGSPASCAGGIKTTSAAVYLAEVRARLKGNREVVLFGRRLSHEVIAKVTLVIGLAVLWNMIGCMFLSLSEAGRPGVRFEALVFEQISAFGTVGLSTGITPQLSTAAKVWIILTMFIGRVGPLTAALALLPRDPGGVRYPEERIMIG